MDEPEALPVELIGQQLTQLRAIANALAPTEAVQTILNSDNALKYPKLMQYSCGTEHLELAIAYLERAIGERVADQNASLD